MKYRNAKYTATGLIDCEINHPEFGWIPFTADPADTGAQFNVAELVAQIESDGNIAAYVPPAITSDQVNIERDRRIRSAFEFPAGEGVTWLFGFDEGSAESISGAATLAGFAMGAGAMPGDFYWHGGAQPFSWILHDNSIVQIDAPTMFAIGQVAAKWKSAHIFAARFLKDADPIPSDYAENDAYWP